MREVLSHGHNGHTVGRVVSTARCYASAIYAAVVVCLSVTSQHYTKMAKCRIMQQRGTIVQVLYFSDAKNLGEIPMGSPSTTAPNRGGVGFPSAIFHQYLAVSQKRCKIGT